MKCRVIIHKERCKGCGFCVAYCPKSVLKLSGELNSMGYHYAEVISDNCIGCTYCTLMCPDVAIELLAVDSKKE